MTADPYLKKALARFYEQLQQEHREAVRKAQEAELAAGLAQLEAAELAKMLAAIKPLVATDNGIPHEQRDTP